MSSSGKDDHNLRRLFREACLIYHPDKARNVKERELFTRIMAEINAAYDARDRDKLRSLMGLKKESPGKKEGSPGKRKESPGKKAKAWFKAVDIGRWKKGLTIALVFLSAFGLIHLAMNIDLGSDVATGRFYRGNEYLEEGNYDQAIKDDTAKIKDSSKAIELDSDDPAVWFNRGFAWRHKGNYDQAIKDYSKAIELNPDIADAWYGRGNAYYNKGDYDQAIKDCSEAIRLKPDLYSAWCNRGLAYLEKGDYDRALKDVNEAYRRAPEVAYWRNGLPTGKLRAEVLDAPVEKYTMGLGIDKETEVQNEWKALLMRSFRSHEMISNLTFIGRGSLVREGGSEGTESAVLAALDWLYRHQDADGGWKAADFNNDSVRERRGPSANRDAKRYPKDTGWAANDVGVTGLAILAFTGFGHTHMDGEYDHFVDCLKKAVKYMLKQQTMRTGDPSKDGCYGPTATDWWRTASNVYNHSIATMAMAELLLMSNDFNLKRSVKEATKLCLLAQNDGRGWRYGIKPGDNDTSVTGWMVQALKTAKQCHLGVPKQEFQDAFAGALKWFESTTNSSGRTGYNVPGDEGSRLAGPGIPDPYPFSKDLPCMTAVGVLGRLFAGQSREDYSIRLGVDILNQQPPMWREQKGRSLSSINIYYWYYGTYAMHTIGGKPWQEWDQKMQRILVDTQRAEYRDDSPEVDGSWDPIGEWGIRGGRVYSTALGARTLEVYYRFERK